MKFKFGYSIILPVLVIALIIGGWLTFSNSPKDMPITQYKFQGADLSFRDDLRLAQNISISPDEESILNTIWGENIQYITIVYMNTSDSQFTGINAFEIAFKLNVAYRQFNWFVNFDTLEVESFENLTGNPENLLVVLIPPSLANKTQVELKDDVAYIQGTTQKEFDLATIKFIMSALNITV